MKDYRDLHVWGKAHELTLAIYLVTKNFPKKVLYGLTNQIRRASSSVGANIAEGCGRSGDAELARLVSIASGSAFELDYHLLLAKDLGFVKEEVYNSLHENVSELRRMLNSFIQKLKANS